MGTGQGQVQVKNERAPTHECTRGVCRVNTAVLAKYILQLNSRYSGRFNIDLELLVSLIMRNIEEQEMSRAAGLVSSDPENETASRILSRGPSSQHTIALPLRHSFLKIVLTLVLERSCLALCSGTMYRGAQEISHAGI